MAVWMWQNAWIPDARSWKSVVKFVSQQCTLHMCLISCTAMLHMWFTMAIVPFISVFFGSDFVVAVFFSLLSAVPSIRAHCTKPNTRWRKIKFIHSFINMKWWRRRAKRSHKCGLCMGGINAQTHTYLHLSHPAHMLMKYKVFMLCVPLTLMVACLCAALSITSSWSCGAFYILVA